MKNEGMRGGGDERGWGWGNGGERERGRICEGKGCDQGQDIGRYMWEIAFNA